MNLTDFSSMQLLRMYRRLYSQLPDGGSFGWDWRTLRHCNPGLAFALSAVLAAGRKKYQEEKAR